MRRFLVFALAAAILGLLTNAEVAMSVTMPETPNTGPVPGAKTPVPGSMPPDLFPESTAAPADVTTPVVWEMMRFEEGSDELDAASRQLLRMFAQRARKTGDVSYIQVAVWSDSEMPPGRKSHLSSTDEELARARGAAIRAFLEDEMGFDYVNVMNMAIHGGFISRLFPTDSERVRAARAAGDEPKVIQETLLPIVEYGGPGLAVFVAAFRPRLPLVADPYYFGVSPWHY